MHYNFTQFTKSFYLLLISLCLSNHVFSQWTSIEGGGGNLLRDVQFTNDTLGIIVGDAILKTIDGGETWTTGASVISDTRYYGVCMKDKLNIWAVGKKKTSSTAGRIHYSTDGGQTWYVYLTGTVNLPWWSVDFSDDGLNGIIVGQGGQILFTTDGGQNWFKRTSPTGDAGTIKDVSFADPLNAVAVGWYSPGDGFIIKTTNGGSSWQIVADHLPSTLNSVSFGDNKQAIAVGSSGKIFRSIDAGSSWVEAPSGTTGTLNSVHYDIDKNLYVAGSGGTVLYSGNNGVSWEIQTTTTTYNLNGIYNVTDRSVIAVGPVGAIVQKGCISSGNPSIIFLDDDTDPNNENNTAPFRAPNFVTQAKNYFYYYVEDNCDLPPKNKEISHLFSDGARDIFLDIKNIGDGILQCSVDLALVNYSAGETITISFPDTVSLDGQEYQLTNKPRSFSLTMVDNSKKQSIDLFAGASIGANVILGGVGAGPSIAAAKISASGSGGMGLTFERETSGIQKISRRFEAGVATSVNIPSIDLGISDLSVKSGIEAGLSVTGSLGQTMGFPNTLSEDLTKKAKAAYLLETFAIGGLNLSPFAGIFLGALQKSLVATNPDLNSIYSGLLESNQRGEVLEGTASLGFSYEFGPYNLTLSELATNVTMSRMKVDELSTGKESIKFGYAKGYNAAILDFKAYDTDIASAFDFSAGSDIAITADLLGPDVKRFVLSFATTEKSTQINILNYSKGHNYDFEVPEQVILDNYGKNNVLGSISSMLGNGQHYPFNVGVNSFTGALSDMYQTGKDTLVNYQEHTLMNTRTVSSIGVKSDTSVPLNAALGFGGGLSLGMEYSYMDNLEYMEKSHVVAEGHVLPMLENSVFADNDRFFYLKPEIDDLFDGVALLIQGSLNELVKKYEALKDGANSVLMSVSDGAVELFGTVSQGTKWVLRTLDPSYPTAIQKPASFNSAVKQAYVSRAHAGGKTSKSSIGKNVNALAGTTLYIISDNVNVNLLDADDNVVETFDPVNLSVTIDQAKVDELGFTDVEKDFAKLYFYDEVNLSWEEITGDINADINIVETEIVNSGNYAIGIAYDSATMDNTAPDIQDHYPQQGNIIPSLDEYYATFFESITGAGIDLSQTILKVDDVQVDALWDPVSQRMLYTPLTPLSDGQHIFDIIVKDLNGNTNSLSATYTVDSSLSVDDISAINQFKIYPNPTQDVINISGDISVLESIHLYDIGGRHIRSFTTGLDKIDMSSLKPALYFLKLSSAEGLRIIKIIKE